MTKKKKEKTYKSTDEALKDLINKHNSKQFKQEAKLKLERLKHGTIGNVGITRQVAQNRQRRMGIMGSRAEQLEIEMVNLNEVPLLHDMERQRTNASTPPDSWMTRVIKQTSDSFPD